MPHPPLPPACLPAPALPAGPPAHLGELFSRVDGAKQRSIIQHMSKDLIPIMEKGLVDCPLVHRCVTQPPHITTTFLDREVAAAPAVPLPWDFSAAAAAAAPPPAPYPLFCEPTARLFRHAPFSRHHPAGWWRSSWNIPLPPWWQTRRRTCRETPCCTSCTPRRASRRPAWRWPTAPPRTGRKRSSA